MSMPKKKYRVRSFALDEKSYAACVELADDNMISISAAARILILAGVDANKQKQQAVC
jgi:hypothetical protein